jgi:hypothetical protein
MKKLVVVVIAALALAGAAAAGTAGQSANGSAHLVVHDVFGLQTLELRTFTFNARVSRGDAADGWFNYQEIDDGAPFTADGPVMCLTVIGNDAWIGATIQKANDASYDGLGAWWHVTDNGEGANAASDVTTFMGVGSAEDTQAFCDTHPAYRHPFPIDHGNIQVRG